jgi:hypothetical protein
MESTLRRIGFTLCVAVIATSLVFAQKSKLVLRDTLDNKLDVGNYLINLHGFVPVPVIISEPALGNFGVALGLVGISPKKKLKGAEGFHFPDITAVAGLYPLNDTWGAAAFRQGSFPSIGMRYRVVLLYADVNLNFYRDIPSQDEHEFLVQLSPSGLILDASENIFRNKLFLGTSYQFIHMNVKSDFPNIPEDVFDPGELESNLSILGLYGELDTRNSIFTPDRGLRLKSTYYFGRDWTGSDVNTDRFELFSTWFFQPFSWWTVGLKGEFLTVSDDSPFYYYPFILMRGIPVMRYQGEQTLLFETEERFDINPRWSLVGFVGSGRAYSESEYLSDDQWHWAGGVGFRYLLARLFHLRVGIDLAAGPDQFAYYLN